MDAVRQTRLLDSAPEYVFDRVVSLAASLFDAPVAVMTIVDSDRIWFKARHGINIDQIGRDPGLCGSAILQDGPWIISDARQDPRARNNPLVTGPLGVRFYIGIPLRLREGGRIGTLCVIDQRPRTIEETKLQGLSDLAAMIVEHIDLRMLMYRVKDNLRETLNSHAALHRQAEASLRSLEDRLEGDMSIMSLMMGAPLVATLPDQRPEMETGMPEIFIDGIPLGLPAGDLSGLAMLVEGFLASAVSRGASRIDIDAQPDGSGLSLTVQKRQN